MIEGAFSRTSSAEVSIQVLSPVGIQAWRQPRGCSAAICSHRDLCGSAVWAGQPGDTTLYPC